MNPKHRAWSPAAEAKLRALYASTPLSRLAFLLKRTEKAVKSRAKLLGVQRGTRRPWTRRETAVLCARYRDEPTVDIARDLRRSVASVHNQVHKLGLEKSPEVARMLGSIYAQHPNSIAARFKPGLVPANKGLRRPGYAPGRMRETQFKKGRPAHEARNYVQIGTEKFDVKRKVIVRKITDDPSIFPAMRWRPVHVLVWVAANGPIPAGSICIFKPGMKTLVSSEITVNRLEVVTCAENMRRNTVHNLPAPLPELVLLRGRLNRKINKRTRAHEEQNGRPA